MLASHSGARPRVAFTLVELLVVIAIIGILVAMLMPSIQSARESGRETQCRSRHREIVTGMNVHLQQRGFFPHGTYNDLDSTFHTPPPYNDWQDRRCWFHDLLPYIEQENLFDRFEEHMKTNRSALSFPDMQTVVTITMCPSDPLGPKLDTFWGGIGTPEQGFSGNMVLCAGNGYFNEGGPVNSRSLNGLFFAQSKVRAADVKDGLTNTVMVSELILSPDTDSHDIRGRYYNPAHGGVLFSTRVPPNTDVPDQLNWCSNNPVPQAPCIWTGTNMFVSARSYHPGGVNIGLAGGAVRFLSENIDFEIYKALGSRNGREVAEAF